MPFAFSLMPVVGLLALIVRPSAAALPAVAYPILAIGFAMQAYFWGLWGGFCSWLAAGTAGTPDAIAVDRILELQIAKQEAEGNSKLVASTDNLAVATRRLGTVTMWLIVGALLMGVAAAIDSVLKLMRVAR